MKINFIRNLIKGKSIGSKVVLGRVACVGKDVFKIKAKDEHTKLINMQKARFDLLLDWINGEITPKSKVIENHLYRKDILPFIKQQEKLQWFSLNSNIDYLLFDSYAEFTDQKFQHREEGWSFCCHYTDLLHTDEFNRTFENCGLLPLNILENTYSSFFDWVESNYPNKLMIFIHYSARFDDRKEFKDREKEINIIIKNESMKRPNLLNLYLDEQYYLRPKNDDYPYHYSKKTYKCLVKKWNDLESIKEKYN